MKALISDTTKKTIRYDEAYHITVKNYGEGTTLELDTEMIPEVKSLLANARKNGCKDWKYAKDGLKEDGSIKWKKEYLDPQEKLD